MVSSRDLLCRIFQVDYARVLPSHKLSPYEKLPPLTTGTKRLQGWDQNQHHAFRLVIGWNMHTLRYDELNYTSRRGYIYIYIYEVTFLHCKAVGGRCPKPQTPLFGDRNGPSVSSHAANIQSLESNHHKQHHMNQLDLNKHVRAAS